jgi:1,4-dihydroxy-6-naphthoate synthase
MEGLIQKSIKYAFSKYPELNDYIRKHSQEMSEEVMRKHIDLYVNHYSDNLGQEGQKAILKLLDVYSVVNNSSINQQDIFIKNTV